MDFDREQELEDAGIDAFEFSLMDEGERREVTPSSSAGKNKKKTGSKLPASDYVHPDDFYYDYYDDFDDYEDAEEYWEEYG